MAKVMVMIPTYNERKNIALLIKKIKQLDKKIEIVVVDDNSPDKTWQVVGKIAKNDNTIHLLLRKKDKGRGYAGRDGFVYCLNKGADIIIEMDADLSHDPKYIPTLLKEIKNYDVVIGSREVKGAKDVDRGIGRQLLTKLANGYVKLFLGLPIKDCNSGYRCFRRKVLQGIHAEKLKAKDADIVQEVIYKCYLHGYTIKEIPVIFKDRKIGKTTKTWKDFAKGLGIVLKLRLMAATGRLEQR